jgi:hypothetical protein
MSRSGMIQWVTAAAVIAVLGTPTGAADLLPPLSQRHLPHRPLGHLPIVPLGHLPRASDGRAAEPALDGPGVVALVGEGVAAGVAQHVRVRLERRRPAVFAGRPSGMHRVLTAPLRRGPATSLRRG